MSSLEIAEIYKSVQGETSFAGLPCVFVRFGRCDLACTYCDSEFAKVEYTQMRIEEVIEQVEGFKCDLVCLTGGEPLLQEELNDLIDALANLHHTVLVETNGANPIGGLPDSARVILDLKCPGSSMSERIDWDNLEHIRPEDEVKFVISDRADFDWAMEVVGKYRLAEKTGVLMSAVFDRLATLSLAEWIIDSGENIRLNLQIHKYIWRADQRGV